jgi:predicted RNA-binding Zn-ribbon protein involved in translation (DUF1610 family)
MKANDIKLDCSSCGWQFTIHDVPSTAEYRNTDWFCPHCGGSVRELPLRLGVKDDTRKR